MQVGRGVCAKTFFQQIASVTKIHKHTYIHFTPYHRTIFFRHGTLHSAKDKEENLLRQKEFARLLLETSDGKRRQLPVPSPPDVMPGEKFASVYSQVEELVLQGETEQAVQVAIKHRMWPHALVLSTSVGRECYQKTVEAFTQQQLPAASPLSGLFRQSVGIGLVPARRPNETPTQSQKRRQQAAQCLTHWRAQLAGLINHPKGHAATSEQMVKLGDALLDPLVYSGSIGPIGGGGTCAAHLCYLASGMWHELSWISYLINTPRHQLETNAQRTPVTVSLSPLHRATS